MIFFLVFASVCTLCTLMSGPSLNGYFVFGLNGPRNECRNCDLKIATVKMVSDLFEMPDPTL